MTGFEPRTSCIGSNRSTNWATQPLPLNVTFKQYFSEKTMNLSMILARILGEYGKHADLETTTAALSSEMVV